MINIYKQPKSASIYANLFIQEIPDNVENVCLLFIGHLETIYDILVTKPSVNFTVIDGKDTTDALPYIYNGANLKENITFEDGWCEDNDTIVENLQSIFNNMSFNLVVSNPPYGKSSSLSKKIINKMLENKIAEEYVVLAPWKTFEEKLEYTKDWKNITNVFEDADVDGLAVVRLFSDKVEKYKEVAEVLLNKTQYKLYNALQVYNKKNKCKAVCRAFDKQLDDVLSGKLKPDNWFLVTKRSANNKVHTGNKSKDYRYNLLGEDIKDVGIVFCDNYFAFPNKEALKNFTSWWYKVPGTGPDAQKTLVYQLLKLIQDLTGSSNGSKWYNIIFPNVDWSKPHTDAEILAEIGLPEDFLEKE